MYTIVPVQEDCRKLRNVLASCTGVPGTILPSRAQNWYNCTLVMRVVTTHDERSFNPSLCLADSYFTKVLALATGIVLILRVRSYYVI